MTSATRRLGIIPVSALAIFLAWMGYLYFGFFEVDAPFYYGPNGEANRLAWIMSWSFKIIFPVLTFLIAALMVFSYRRRLLLTSLGVLVVGGGIAAGLGYLILAFVYYDLLRPSLPAEYHPYLQLAPSNEELKKLEPSQSKKIFCLGGSTTKWRNSEGQAWTELLEKDLNNGSPAKEVQVLNFGQEWYTSLHSFINYSVNLKPYKPNIILVMHALNDLLHNADFSYMSAGEFRDDYGHFLGPVTNLVQGRSLPELFRRKLRTIWYPTQRSIRSTEHFPGLKPFRRNIENLISLAKTDGTTVVLLTEPYLFKPEMSEAEFRSLYMLTREAVGPELKWDLATALSGMQQYNETIKAIARESQTALIDLEQALPKNLDYFSDDVHYKDKAFPVIGQYLAKELRSKEILH